jgi:hypothetical protein
MLPVVPARPALRALWPAAWRSLLGVALIVGANQGGAIFYAQIGEPRTIAIYLLTLRLLETIAAVARTPFYARIPELVRLHAQGSTEQQLAVARTGMRFTYWLIVAGLLSASALGPAIFKALGSDVPFPPRTLWLALGCAYLLDRYGAMHLQLYSTTNRIVWHTAAGGYAVLYLVSLASTFDWLGIYTFPVAMLIGYAGWYCWYCAAHSYGAFGISPWRFERGLFLPPFAVACCATALAWRFS